MRIVILAGGEGRNMGQFRAYSSQLNGMCFIGHGQNASCSSYVPVLPVLLSGVLLRIKISWSKMMIEKARFGRTNHLSSRIIFGAAALWTIDQNRTARALDLLLEYGINHIDTAANYGDSEVCIGPCSVLDVGLNLNSLAALSGSCASGAC
jgi:hypothetical protein